MSDSLINKGDIAQHAAAESIDRSAYLPATPWLQLMLVGCLFAQLVWNLFGDPLADKLSRLYRFLFAFAIRRGWVKE